MLFRSGGRDNLQPNLGGSRSNHADALRGGAGKIDDASRHEGSTVSDPHIHGFSISQILNTNPGSERKRAMSRGEFLHVVSFTVGRPPAVIGMAIPARQSDFGVSGRRRRNHRHPHSLLVTASGQEGDDREQDNGLKPLGTGLRTPMQLSNGHCRSPVFPYNNSILKRFFSASAAPLLMGPRPKFIFFLTFILNNLIYESHCDLHGSQI